MSSSILFPTNQYTTSSKSPQQLQRLMIPSEYYSSLQQTINYIITKGNQPQYQYVYRYYHKLHEYQPSLQFVLNQLLNENIQNQMLIGQSLKILLEKIIILNDNIGQLMFNTIIQCLNNLHSTTNEIMMKILQEILGRQSIFRKKLETIILDLGKPTQTIISKVTAGRLITSLTIIDNRNIKGQMIDILKRILADNEIEARKVWLSELFPKLLKNVNLQFIELHLQQKIYQTIYDQNEQVGLLALQAILNNINKFSFEQKSTRIIKLFLDSLTSKNQKISIMVTSKMGQIYQQLENIILKNYNKCLRFWQAIIELSQSKNQQIINNIIYNLPGIITLASFHYKINSICLIYIELYYQVGSNKNLLISYFHLMVKLFPNYHKQLQQIIYQIFNQIIQQNYQMIQLEQIKIIDNFIQQLQSCKIVVCKNNLKNNNNNDNKDILNIKINQQNNNINVQKNNKLILELHSTQNLIFEQTFCQYYLSYYSILLNKKNTNYLYTFYYSIKKCYDIFPLDFIEIHLLPKLYQSIRYKTAHLDLVMEIIVMLISRNIGNNTLVNNYASKINIQMSKSNKSYQRQSALLFFYYATFYFSIETFQQFKFGSKFLNLNNDRIFKNKALFIKFLPRLIYFFTRQQKIQNVVILNRLKKDQQQINIIQLINKVQLIQLDHLKKQIFEQSQRIRQIQRTIINAKIGTHNNNTGLNNIKNTVKRQSKDVINKQDILKKRLETKSKTKILIKQFSKKKTIPLRNGGVNQIKNI